MLNIINQSLGELLEHRTKKLNEAERLTLFLETNKTTFARQDYMKHYTEISSATASRDLKNGVDKGFLKKTGDKKTTRYKAMKIH